MKEPLYELGKDINLDLILSLSTQIKEIFPNNNCYFIGSTCINGVYKSDIDFTVLMEGQISKEEIRQFRNLIWMIDKRLQIMFTFINDQEDLKEYPYISAQDINDRKIVNRNDYTTKEFEELKKQMTNQLWKKKKYYKEGLVRELTL